MKRILNIFFILLFTAVIFSDVGCRKALKEHPDFEGTWQALVNNTEKIKIDHDDNASIQIFLNSFGTSRDYHGKARISNGRLKIGRWDGRIDEYPSYDADGNSYFNVDGKIYYGTCVPWADTIANITSNSAIIVAGTKRYYANIYLEYRQATTSSWAKVFMGSVTASVLTLNNLSSSTTYEIRMQSDIDGYMSRYSPVYTFTTL